MLLSNSFLNWIRNTKLAFLLNDLNNGAAKIKISSVKSLYLIPRCHLVVILRRNFNLLRHKVQKFTLLLLNNYFLTCFKAYRNTFCEQLLKKREGEEEEIQCTLLRDHNMCFTWCLLHQTHALRTIKRHLSASDAVRLLHYCKTVLIVFETRFCVEMSPIRSSICEW